MALLLGEILFGCLRLLELAVPRDTQTFPLET